MPSRVLRIDLGHLQGGTRSPAVSRLEPQGPWATLAEWGGTALGIACLHAERSEPRAASEPEPLVLAVGGAVRAGLPTAARAAVLARAPLSGRYAEGHVGGELGASLACTVDALVLCGRTTLPGAVLVVEEDGSAALLARPALRGRPPGETAQALEQELGARAVLAIGPAGERGLPFASLAVGHSPPSFVGRGGLGAVFGGLGLKALVVRTRPSPRGQRSGAAALITLLEASPRLAARAAGGTLELYDAWAARGALEPEGARALAREGRERASTRHGCRGCPTPCGWSFERSDGVRQGARFGASHALGPVLGLERLDDSLHLLQLCDHLGMDAKEVGAILALRARVEAPGRERLAAWITELVRDPSAPGRSGAARLARALGIEHEQPTSHGQAVRPETDRATLLGQCVGSGGADPMRTFPFLVESADLSRLRALLDPVPIGAAALDGASSSEKGRLVFWHENLIAAVDMTGFCAFSAAGLLADGACDLDRLATWILPDVLRDPGPGSAWGALAPGQRMLAAGASLVLARHECNLVFGGGDLERPAFARALLEEPGMLPEYLALRGLDERGHPGRSARSAFATPRAHLVGRDTLSASPESASGKAAEPREPGRVTLRAGGALAELLGECSELRLELPAPLVEVLGHALDGGASDPERKERLASLLLHDGVPVPAVWRAGRRLLPGEPVRSGDVLELVTALSGG